MKRCVLRIFCLITFIIFLLNINIVSAKSNYRIEVYYSSRTLQVFYHNKPFFKTKISYGTNSNKLTAGNYVLSKRRKVVTKDRARFINFFEFRKIKKNGKKSKLLGKGFHSGKYLFNRKKNKWVLQRNQWGKRVTQGCIRVKDYDYYIYMLPTNTRVRIYDHDDKSS